MMRNRTGWKQGPSRVMGVKGSRSEKIKEYWNATPRMNLNINYRLWVIMTSQCRFINCDIVPLRWGVLMMSRPCMCGVGYTSNLCNFLSILLRT